MKYIDLSKPHAYLIWRGKQKAIVSPELLPVGEKMLIIQDGKEAFGEVVLGKPAQINITEFERLEEEHSTRPEERKLKWPNQDSFYLYRFKDWRPFPDARDIEIDNGSAELLPIPELSEEESKLLEQAERLPKTLVLKDEAVILEDGQVSFCEGLDGSKVMPILAATLEENKQVKDSLALYQLALVRIPRLKLKKNMDNEFDEDEKYNPWHDNLGRFASGSGGGAGLTHVPDKRKPATETPKPAGGGGGATAPSKPTPTKPEKPSESKFGWRSKDMQNTEETIAPKQEEHAAVFDKNGKKLFETTSDSADEVTFTDSQLKQMNGAVITHNHPDYNGKFPDGGSFSFSDVQLMNNTGAAEVRAVTKNYVYVIKPKFIGNTNLSKNAIFQATGISEKLKPDMMAQVKSGKLKWGEAQAEHMHKVWSEVADLGFVNYERIPR